MAWNVHLPKGEYYPPGDPAIKEIAASLRDEKLVAIDTETTGLTVWKDIPLFFSLSWGEHRRLCLRAESLGDFAEIFADPARDWVFANAKYDMHMLANVGFEIAGRVVDVQVMHALLYEEQSHKLGDIGHQLLNWSWKDGMADWDKRQFPNVGDFWNDLWKRDPQKLVEYASNDAYATLQIYHKLKAELQEAWVYSLYPSIYKTLWDIFDKTEVPFTKVLWKLERRGVRIDLDYLNKLVSPIQEEIDATEREIVKIAGRLLNPSSPKQLREYFFDELKVRPLSYTQGGKSGVKMPQTNSAFLEHYAADIPVASLLVRHRDLSKFLSTFVKGMSTQVDAHGRIHTRFNQDITRTGRLSSSGPNLQNVPNAEKDQFKVRAAFIPKEGYTLICVDYSALEMRLLATASQERDMIEVFLNGWDIHMGNAAMVFGLPYEDIKAAKKKPKDELTPYDHKCLRARMDIKAIAFGLNYGMKENLLAKNLGVSVEEALALMKQYMNRYPAVKQFYEQCIEECRETGYAFSVLGRRRFLPEVLSHRQVDRWRAERQAVNMQVQGSAADVVKMAMICLDEADLAGRLDCHMVLQVHDELLFECREDTAEQAMEEIREWMEHSLHADLDVPLLVDGGIAKTWAEAK